jgi:gliding motility-associated-like protein
MKQVLRLIILFGFIASPFLSRAQVTASFSGSPRTGCAPIFFTATDASTPSGVSHEFIIYWDSTYHIGGSVDTARVLFGRSSSHTFTTSLDSVGYYDVLDSVYNSSGTVHIDTMHDYVLASPTPVTSVTTTTPNACVGSTVIFHNASQTVAGYTPQFTWTIVGPTGSSTYTTTGTTPTISRTFTTVGTYVVYTHEVNPGSGCGSIDSVLTVSIGGRPTACFSNNDSTPCSAPAMVTFTNCSSAGAVTYLWKFGDGTTSTATSPAHTYSASGTITDTLIAYSSYGCADTLIDTGNIIIGNFNPAFTVSASTICAADAISTGTITFTDVTPGATGHNWHDNYVPNHTSTAASPTFTYSVGGTYTITDSSFNNAGCSGVITHTVSVYGAPTVTVTANHLYRCLANDTVTFTPSVTDPSAITSYEWYYGDGHTLSGTVPPALTSVTHIYTASGTYSDSLKVTDANGCSNLAVNSSYIKVGVTPTFLVSASSSDSGCAPFYFTYNTTISSSLSYTLDSIKFGDSCCYVHLTAGTTSGAHTYYAGGTHTVTAVYTLADSLGGCTYTAPTTTVTVGTVVPTFSPVFSPSDTVCPHTTFSITCGCPGCTSFSYNFNGTGTPPTFSGTSVSTCTTTYQYATAGAHSILATADENGCTSKDTLSFYVLPPAAAFSYSVASCAADSVITFYATADTVGGGGASGFHWSFSDGGSATGIVTTHTFAANHVYTVILVDSAGAIGTLHRCTNADTQFVHVYNFVDTLKSNHTEACTHQSITLTAATAPGGTYTNYSFHFGDGTPNVSGTAASTNHTYNTTGYFKDTVIIKNSLGCYDTVRSVDTIAGLAGGATAGGVLSDTTCPYNSISFADNNTDFTGFTITRRHWTFNAPPASTSPGSPSTAATPYPLAAMDTSITYPEGIYSIVLVDSDNIGCTVRDTMHVVTKRPHAYFYSSDSSYQACIGATIHFTDTNSHVTYAWTFGDGTTGTGQNPPHTYSANGTYTVRVIITTAAGDGFPSFCSDTMIRTAYVTVGLLPVTYTPTDTTGSCQPLSGVAFNTTPSSDGYSYQWRVTPYGNIVSTNPIFYNYSLGGGINNYTVTLVGTNPLGCKDSAVHHFVIGGPAGYDSVTTDNGCGPLTVTMCFVDTNGIYPDTYTWQPGDGTAAPASASSCYTYTYPVGDSANSSTPVVTLTSGSCPTGFTVSLHNDSITVYPPPVINIVHDTSLCYGHPIVLTARGGDPGETISWSPSAGLSCTTCFSPVVNPTVTTTYTIIATSAHGCMDTAYTTIHVDPMISVSISGHDSVCTASTDTLVATGAGGSGPGTYTWTTPTGATTTGNTIRAVALTGDHTYTVVYTDTAGCRADTTKLVYGVALPDSIVGPSKICQGDSILLTDDTPGDTWVSSNPGIASVSSTGYVVGVSLGNATISYVNATGCQQTHTVTVNFAPGPIGGSSNVCLKDTIHLSDAVTAGGTWTSAETSIATVGQFTGVVFGAETGAATISFTLPNGCAVYKIVNVQPLPDTSFTSIPLRTPNGVYVCRNDSTQVFLSTTGMGSYLWSPNIFLSSDTVSNPYLHDTANIVFKIIETSIYGCKDSLHIPVTVYDSAYTFISSDTSICQGKSAQLNALSTSDTVTGDQTIYTWTPASTLSNPDIHNPVATPDTTTTYTVNIVENPCFNAQREVTVTVIPAPAIVLSSVSPIIAGTSIQLTATITNGVYVSEWMWSPGNTLSCDTCYNPVATPTATTTYSVIATTPIGCTGNAEVTVPIVCVEASQVFVPNTFTPNGDGSNDRFYMSGKGLGLISRMSVYNRWGEEVFHAENINANDAGAGWDGTYRGQVLPPDVFVYVFELVCETGVPFTLKGDISLVR